MILIVAVERLPMKITRAVDIATKDRLQSLKIESEYLLMTAPLRNSKEYARLKIVEEKIKQSAMPRRRRKLCEFILSSLQKIFSILIMSVNVDY